MKSNRSTYERRLWSSIIFLDTIMDDMKDFT